MGMMSAHLFGTLQHKEIETYLQSRPRYLSQMEMKHVWLTLPLGRSYLLAKATLGQKLKAPECMIRSFGTDE